MEPNPPNQAGTPNVVPGSPDGKTKPEKERLQDVLPEICDVAQKVGGMRQLAEIAKDLEESKE